MKTKRTICIGDKFGRLEVIGKDEEKTKEKKKEYWFCKCSCNSGIIKSYIKGNLINGTVRSCGCIKKETTSKLGSQRKGEKYKENKYDLSGEYGIGWTYNTNEEFYFDLEDYEKIKKYAWRAVKHKRKNGTEYVSIITSTHPQERKTETITMAQLIMGGNMYDHANRNTYDNRKNNLRPSNYSQNGANSPIRSNNTSGFIGVTYNKRAKKWKATIKKNGERVHLGYYTNKEDAVIARLKAEKEFFGEFAPQRHLFDKYGIN